MRVLLLAPLCLGVACTIPLVPTDRGHISWRHRGHLEKLGVGVEGTTCGDEYMRAVAGVPEAERLMTTCSHETTIYAAGMLGFVAAPVAAGVLAWQTDVSARTAVPIGLGIGAVSFVVGFAAAMFAGHDLEDAVSAYNLAVDSGVEQR